MRTLQLAAFVATALITGAAQASESVDLDRICVLNGQGYEAGDVVLEPNKGVVCSMVTGRATWLTMNQESVALVLKLQENEASQGSASE